MTFEQITKKVRANKEVRKIERMYRQAFELKLSDFKREMIKKYTAERSEEMKHTAELYELGLCEVYEIFDGIRV